MMTVGRALMARSHSPRSVAFDEGMHAMDNSFDWFVGTWQSAQRRLRRPLAGRHEWYEFSGEHRCWNVLDGAANVDEALFPSEGFGGVTLRLYDKERDVWSLYWASSRTGLSPEPVVGRFGEDGRGVFIGDDTWEGRSIKVLYVWSDITETTARWEQSFSADGGATWELNWVAEFSRRE
jgi:hypothetical protein